MPKPETFISRVMEKAEDGRLVDESTQKHVVEQLEAFVEWVERMR